MKTKTYKGLHLDTFGPKRSFGSAVLYLLCLFIIFIIGFVAPNAYENDKSTVMGTCPDPSNCEVTLDVIFEDMDAYKQLAELEIAVHRPLSNVTNAPVMANQLLYFFQLWKLHVTNEHGEVLADNKMISTQVLCFPISDKDMAAGLNGEKPFPACSSIHAFGQSLLLHKQYNVQITLINPFDAFKDIEGIKPDVQVTVTKTSINPGYTRFESGWKIFFCVLTIFIWVYYVFVLFCGKSAKDVDGKRLRTPMQQSWLVVLGLLLFFYNDPAFIASITSPSISLAGFQGLCTATFLAALLLYSLIVLDLARKQGENGSQVFRMKTKGQGAWFWIPKILICCICWALLFAIYVFQRIMAIQDPSFDIYNALGTDFTRWINGFIAAFIVLYILYVFGLLVLSFRNYSTMHPSNKFFIGITLFTMLLVVIGLFVSSFASVRMKSAAFITSYGTVNFYIWMLMILFRPGPPVTNVSTPAVGVSALPPIPTEEEIAQMSPADVRGFISNVYLQIENEQKIISTSEISNKAQQFVAKVREGRQGGRGQQPVAPPIGPLDTNFSVNIPDEAPPNAY